MQCGITTNQNSEVLTHLFDSLFAASEGTRLIRGSSEPLYLPRDAAVPYDRVVFAHGFFASALHEIAHWCIAGPERRKLNDYGYWYKPSGRTAAEQQEFECVEVRPQALEWIFSVAAGSQFHFSADNLENGGVCLESWRRFQAKVVVQAHAYVQGTLPRRAEMFAEGLSQVFGTGDGWRRVEAYALPK